MSVTSMPQSAFPAQDAPREEVVVGVDTHPDMHVAAVVTIGGRFAAAQKLLAHWRCARAIEPAAEGSDYRATLFPWTRSHRATWAGDLRRRASVRHAELLTGSG